jgi:hypothetical protein
VRSYGGVDGLVYFGLSGAAFLYSMSLLRTKYILKTKRAQRDRGAFLAFAIFMLLMSFAALALGLISR